MANAVTAQLLGHLRASRVEHGLLINFGAGTFFIIQFVKSGALVEVSYRRRFPDPRQPIANVASAWDETSSRS